MRVAILFMMVCVLGFGSLSVKRNDVDGQYNRLTPGVQDSTILWNKQRKLTWDDFRGVADSLSSYKAMTYVQIGLVSEEKKGYIIVDVPTYFFKNLSWKKEKTSILLTHEQLHFDIAELIARKIRKEFLNYKPINYKNTYIDLQEIYRVNYRVKLDSLNKSYDSETKHGVIKDKQKEWELKIARELKALEKYAGMRVVIKRLGE